MKSTYVFCFFLLFFFQEESFNYITLHPEVLESEMFEELPDTLKQSIEDRIRQNM